MSMMQFIREIDNEHARKLRLIEACKDLVRHAYHRKREIAEVYTEHLSRVELILEEIEPGWKDND